MKKLTSIALTATLLFFAHTANAVIISNTPDGSAVSPFGSPNTQTYGQVFVAPLTGTLDSFTLSLTGGVGEIVGAVGSWNGTSTFGTGFGSDSTLFTSAVLDSGSGGDYTFAPSISVTAGNVYVAFLTTFGLVADTTTTMPLADALPGGGYFVFHNGGDPFGASAWDYFTDFGNVAFSAEFSADDSVAMPVPGSAYLLSLGLIALGWARRKQA